MSEVTIDEFEQIGGLLEGGPLYVRHSRGYDVDSTSVSVDGESGLELPGLSANPMNPEDWWTRPWQDWAARQICQYRHLSDKDGDAHVWLLTGRCVGRGPDCEPLLVDVKPLGRLTDAVLDRAEEIYQANFNARLEGGSEEDAQD